MRIDKESLIPSDTPLVGFGSTKVFLVGTITMLVTIRTYLKQLIKEVSFLVIDWSSTCNAIIGQPTLNAWRAATSTYHLLMKFLTEYGVGEAQRDKMATCKCYIPMFEMDDHLQALNIEERSVVEEMIAS